MVKILVVGTKVDEFQHYQVTEQDIEQLCQSMNVPICLVNTKCNITDSHVRQPCVQLKPDCTDSLLCFFFFNFF